MTLGERITRAREDYGISQAELARRIGITRNAMCAIEHRNADPRASRIVAIAAVLGCTTDALLVGTPDEDQTSQTSGTRPWYADLIRTSR